MYRLSFILTALTCLFISCQQVAIPGQPSDLAYFPLETGSYQVYAVREERFSLLDPPVSIDYQLKERTGLPYTDAAGGTSFRIHRFRRAAADQPWLADSILSARVSPMQAIRTENGISQVVLQFPLAANQRWNANAFTNLEPDDVELRNIWQVFRVLDKRYDQTVTVVQQDDSTLVAQDKRMAVYAPDIGLIYRQRTQLRFCTARPDCIGKAQIDYGIRQTYQLLTYGKD